MRTEDIQYLMAAVHEGSMSKAAEQQYISQQNITNAIKRLESELGLALLQRSNKGIQFTAHGKMLQPYLNQILMAVGEINAYAKGQQNDQQADSFSILCLSALSNTLAAFLKDMALQRPYTRISIVEEKQLYDPAYIKTCFLSQAPDVLYTIVLQQDLPQLKELARDYMVDYIGSTALLLQCAKSLKIARRSAVTLAELEQLPLVLHSSADQKTLHQHILKNIEVPLKVCLETNSNRILFDYIENGLASSLAFSCTAHQDLPHIPIVDFPEAALIVVYRQDRISPYLAGLVQYLRGTLPG